MKDEPQNVICQNCKGEFVIEPEDFRFYEKIKVPPPTWCPECRNQRRMAIRNERVFYHRNCDSCGKKLISYYSPNKKYIVWCPECWWSDKLDALKYGRDLDFSRPFFEQFKELMEQVPTLSLDIVNCKDSEYVSYCGDDNHCYMDIAGESNEYCYYCKFVKYSKDCLDCSFVYNSELCSECVNCHKIYGSTFLNRCLDCNDCHFMYDCRGCQNCFGCFNLRNKNYCIFNIQYSRNEYLDKIKEFNKGSNKFLENFKKQFKENSKEAILKFAFLNNCVNCSGNDLAKCKNIKDSFDVSDAENSRYLFDVLDAKECYDLNFSLYRPSFDIELISTLNLGNCGFCTATHYSNHVWYSNKCNSSSDLFGCVGINKKSYCILNKQYEKVEYFSLREKIIKHMEKTGEWGEFFPIGLGGFGYNETVAQEYFPMTRDECLAKGWPWCDESVGTYGKETLKLEEIPDDIKKINESILNEILACSCGRNYKIVSYELKLYQKMNLALPRQCPECRHNKRNKTAGIRKIWSGTCFCEKENHGHIGQCQNDFKTVFPPENQTEIYCEQCYNKEVY